MPELSLDKIIAQKLGELTILNARQAVLIEALRAEIAKRDETIASLQEDSPSATASGGSGGGASIHVVGGAGGGSGGPH